jgi:lipopolysaccharide transport system permease protein
MISTSKRAAFQAKGPFATAIQNRSLTIELSKREILGRYRGASFGLLWSLISPFLMLAVYTFAFGNILKSRWPQTGHEHHSFALILFMGLIVHGFFAECMNRSPQLIVGNSNYVKRVIFPLEILPWPMVLSALFHLMMNLLAFIVLQIVLDSQVNWTIVLFPVVIAPLVLLALGVAWALAALGVYFRDISQITGVLTTALLFTSTAIMPMSAVGLREQWIFQLNPLTFIIDQSREVALWGHLPDWSGLGLYGIAALIVAYMGYSAFMATRKGFADVL